MKTEFYLMVSALFYIECDDMPAAGEYYHTHKNKNNDKLGIVEVDASLRNNQEDTPIYVYFDTQENMMNFQLKYL
jgi:hypothetical protein